MMDSESLSDGGNLIIQYHCIVLTDSKTPVNHPVNHVVDNSV